MIGNRSELTGRRFGRLVVREMAGIDKYKHSTWLCQCDCGNTKIIRGTHLTQNRKPTNSCGCIKREQARVLVRNGLPKGEAALNALYGSYKIRAGKKGVVFDLTREHFRELTSADCFYCGAPPSQVKCDIGYNGGYTYNGIDRLDSGDGYTPNNSVACCGVCNNMKRALSLWEFRGQIKKIYNTFVMGLYE